MLTDHTWSSSLISRLSSYHAQEFTGTLYGREYRFVVVHSSHLDKRKLRGLETRVKKEKEKLKKDVDELKKLTFACEPDAKDALTRFIKKKGSAFYPLDGTVEHSRERVKRNQRGRPPKDEKIEYHDVWRKPVLISSTASSGASASAGRSWAGHRKNRTR